MNLAALSLDNSPHFSLPLRFFVTAPLFLFATGVLLTIYGQELIESRWQAEALALVHLLLLGVVTMVAAGALIQFLPVATGAAVTTSRVVAAMIHMLLTVGVAALAVGLWNTAHLALLIAVPAVFAALLILVFTSFSALLRSRAAYSTVSTIRIALASLLVVLPMGGWLAAGHAGLVPLARFATDLHAAWATAGWLACLVFGVSYQVVPLFQVTPDYPQWMQRWLALLMVFSLFAFTLDGVLSISPGGGSGGELAAIAPQLLVVLFALTTLRLQQRRRRRRRDQTLFLWRFGLLLLVCGALTTVVAQLLVTFDQALMQSALTAMVIVAPLSLLFGMLYKIVPFLVWLHLSNRSLMLGVTSVPLPSMGEAIPLYLARLQIASHLIASILLLISPFLVAFAWGWVVVHLVGFAWSVSGLALFVAIAGAWRLYLERLDQIEQAVQ